MKSTSGVAPIKFSEVYPVKFIIISGFLIGEGLFYGLGSNYAFGLWFGLIVSLVMNSLLVSRARDLVESSSSNGDDKISRRVSLLALARYLIYGLALAATAVTEWFSFFAVAGGILMPTAVLQLKVAAKNTRFGG